MSTVGSEFAKYGIELTDSIYVVLNMLIMTRVGTNVLEALGDSSDFIKGLHARADIDEENRYIGVFKTYCDIDKNTYEEFIAEKQFNSKKYSYEQFLLHISYVFYQKLFYINIEENEIPRSLKVDEDIKKRIEQAIDEKKYFKQIEIKNDTYLIMDSLLFYRGKRVYCVFLKIDDRYKLIQLSTTKETLSNKSNNLI
jgi:hypothetical protein